MSQKRVPAVVRGKLATIVLSILVVVTPTIGAVAVRAEVTATHAACKGSNNAKAATNEILHQLYAQSQTPSDDPGIQQARAQFAARFKPLISRFDTILANESC